jgi:hypothetical protein
VFHVVDKSTRPAGIVIYSLKSEFASPKVGVAGTYEHPKRLATGVFTIRQK